MARDKLDHAILGETPRTITFQRRAGDVSIFDVTFPAHTELDRHRHESAYLCLVVHGVFEEWTNRRHTNVWAGRARDYPEGSEHAVRIGATGARMLHVTDPLQRGWRGERSPLALGLLWQIARAIDREDTRDDADLLHLESLALELRGGAAHDARTPTWLARALARLRQGYAHRVALTELAAEAGTHRSHFARAFKRSCGMTAGQYLRRMRVAAAFHRLGDGDVGLSRLAADTGFADQSHLGRYFRRYVGCTPGDVREYLRTDGRRTALPRAVVTLRAHRPG